MDAGDCCVHYLVKDTVASVGRILYVRRDANAIFSSTWDA